MIEFTKQLNLTRLISSYRIVIPVLMSKIFLSSVTLL